MRDRGPGAPPCARIEDWPTYRCRGELQDMLRYPGVEWLGFVLSLIADNSNPTNPLAIMTPPEVLKHLGLS